MTGPTTGPTAAAWPPASGHAGAAPWYRRVTAQAGLEMRTVLRNGEQLVITLVLPVLLLVVLTRTTAVDLGTGDRIALVAPGVLALAVMSAAFTSQAIATGFDRRNGVLRLLATTPLGRTGLLAGKALGIAAVQAVQMAVLVVVAVVLGWRPVASGVPAAVVLVVLGTTAFTALALLVAGTMRAEAVLAVANLVWVLLLAGGAVLLPADLLPAPLGAVAQLLPSGALGGGLRAALTGGELPAGPVVVLTAWTVGAGALTARLFRWS
ncbi:ABC transporter permease [Cellulomonas carbonis]|uniref:ABC transporter n=1 Tax=Cellulomonas carbonis T26 TaxID=947969 RepID=A0A0A0BYN1_9CELL|nr:ABC transporter permease [Cellulomonas carbonis]KGM12229.1 ABC transporter [Cellulomonas carbonis T26]GGB96561.1 transport permease protein [Cellulomonas carbonis]